MPTDALQSLLAAILADQPERPETDPLLDEARLVRLLAGTQPLTTAEERVLWTSPAVRRQLAALRAAQRAAQYQAWSQIGFVPQIPYLAAAAASVQPVTIATHPGLIIKLFPEDDDGNKWTIWLKLARFVQDVLVSGIRLVDTGGVSWLAGQMDHDGELSADWTYTESPLRRLQRYALRLEPL